VTAPHVPLSISVREAARLLGMSDTAAYDAVHRDEIPTIRIGRRLHVPTRKLAKMFGATPAEMFNACRTTEMFGATDLEVSA
jgi:excisionase family DNA binding protein